MINIVEVTYGWNGNLTTGNDPVAIIEHHAEAIRCTVEDIDRWHKARGWVGIGYHFFIAKDGRIFRGRPEWAWGAQCPGFNDRSIGVCHEGNFMNEQMTPEQKTSSIALNKYLMAKYPKIQNLYQHGTVYPTQCAGINFAQNEIFAGTLSADEPAPTPVTKAWLQVGDTGDKVKELQEKLCKLGYTVSVDGIYGKETKNAIYNFQQDTKICADGLAGDETLAMLDTKIAELNKPKPAPAPVNQDNVNLQHNLNRLKIATLVEDGVVGPLTIEAIRKFQSIVGASIDGVAGSDTLAAINYILTKAVCKQGTTSPILIRYIQWRVGSAIDGVFGPQTRSLVATWQKNNGLTADAIVGPATWSVLIG
jgi:peptidoglycan hydrolase-like protein with peptidoglycan-binding domain